MPTPPPAPETPADKWRRIVNDVPADEWGRHCAPRPERTPPAPSDLAAADERLAAYQACRRELGHCYCSWQGNGCCYRGYVTPPAAAQAPPKRLRWPAWLALACLIWVLAVILMNHV